MHTTVATTDELAAATALLALGFGCVRLPAISKHRVPNTPFSLHAVDDGGERYLFPHELCRILGMNRTTFRYWFRASGISERQRGNKAISATARHIFGGRSSYAFYNVRDIALVLRRIAGSRQSRPNKDRETIQNIMECLQAL